MARHAEFNQADVAAAVSLYLGVDPNRSEIRAIASRINLQGLHVPAGTNLSQSGDFRSRVLAVGGADLEQLVSSQKLIQLQLDADRRGSGGGFGRYLHNSSYDYAVGLSGGDDSDAPVGTPAYWKTERGRSEVAAYAHRHGMGWVAGHRGLLELGPGAIDILRDTQFREETFRRMRDAGFTERNVVDTARYARDRNLDANRLGGAAADWVNGVQGDPENTPQARERRRTLYNNYIENPSAPGAREALEAEMDAHGRRGPQHRQQSDNLRERAGLGAAIATSNNLEANANVLEQSANGRVEVANREEAQADDAFGALAGQPGPQANAPPPATNPPPPANGPAPATPAPPASPPVTPTPPSQPNVRQAALPGVAPT